MNVGGNLFKEDSSKSEMQGLQDGKQEANRCSKSFRDNHISQRYY